MYTLFSLVLNVYVCIQKVEWQSNRKIKLEVCLNCDFVILRGKKVLTFKDFFCYCYFDFFMNNESTTFTMAKIKLILNTSDELEAAAAGKSFATSVK